MTINTLKIERIEEIERYKPKKIDSFFQRLKAKVEKIERIETISNINEKPVIIPAISSKLSTKSTLVKSNQPTRDYTELEATHIYDDGIQGACPLCSHVDKFTICPECYFVRGRFIPTNMLVNKESI